MARAKTRAKAGYGVKTRAKAGGRAVYRAKTRAKAGGRAGYRVKTRVKVQYRTDSPCSTNCLENCLTTNRRRKK